MEILGREAELGALAGFLDGPDRTLVLVGGPGIGKSTLWDAGIGAAAALGFRTLSTRASGAEARLSFAALIDLFDGVSSDELVALPVPQRRALETALLRLEPEPDSQSGAVAVGCLNALRALAGRRPLLVAIDDVHWLDPASADVLTFAAARLDPHSAKFLLAKRHAPASPLERVLAPLEQLEVGSLSLGAVRRLLVERLGLSLPRYLLRQLVDSTLGNPLFALEVGRTLNDRGLPPAGEGLPVPDSVEEVLGVRIARLQPSVRRVLVAVALSGALRLAQLTEIADVAAIDDAVEAGVLVVEGESVRASHPFFAAAARKHSRPRDRRELHHELASVAADAEVRARHLARAAVGADEELAATVSSAATAAFARGARQDAVELADHALRLTPAESDAREERLLALSMHLEVVGEPQRVMDVLAPEVASLSPGRARIGALVQLAECAMRTHGDPQLYLDRALAESGSDSELRAYVLPALAQITRLRPLRRIREGEAWAAEALPAALRAGGDVERFALEALAWARGVLGLPIVGLCRRGGRESHLADSLERALAHQLVWRGESARARRLVAPLLEMADERGESYAYAVLRQQLCELELRVGNWDAAAQLLDDWAESGERQLLSVTTFERCRALLAAGRGDAGEALELAERSIAGAEQAGSMWNLLEARRAQGIALLLAHEPARAAASLRPVWEYTRSEGVDEPGVFPVAPELVEALVELGELEEARAVTDRLGALAESQDHPWGLATSKRCEALVRLGSDKEASTDALEDAAAAYLVLDLRFDGARTLRLLGRAHRRRRKWAAARSALEQSAAAFEAMGSPGWAVEARADLERVGARRPVATGELTPTEQRVVELAAAGLANKEIAAALFVTVNTVETHLSHAYAKLGVRSRTQLGRVLRA